MATWSAAAMRWKKTVGWDKVQRSPHPMAGGEFKPF
jgi:hypothetical protein